MAWRRAKGEEEIIETEPGLGSSTHADDRTELLSEKEAKQRLKQAEADLRRLERTRDRRSRAKASKERAVERRLKRIERSRRRPVSPLVAYVATLNGIAAGAAVLLLLWPDFGLYDPVFYQGATHWEMVALCFMGAAVGSCLMLGAGPSSDYQSRARSAMHVYFATAIVITFCGLLVAVVLVPMEEMDAGLLREVVLVLLLIVACTGIPLPIVHLASHWGRSRFFLTGRYHGVMGTLTAVFVVSLVLLAFFFLAWQGWMEEVGYATAVVGGLGILFPLPALAATIVMGFYLDRVRAAARPY